MKENKLNVKKKKVCETFEIEKEGKTKVVESCGIEEEKIAGENQVKNQNKLFAKIIFVMVGLLAFFFLIMLINYSIKHFEVDGVKFEVDSKSVIGTTLYKTSLPGIVDDEGNFTIGNYQTGNLANYRIWFRGNPKVLKDISFEGNFTLMKNVVWNQEEDYVCDGDYIGIQNVLNVYDVVGATVIKDENASCDEAGRYTYVSVLAGNETFVEQTGPSCYNIYVKDCEILKATERFLLEMLIEVNKQLG